MPNYTTKSGVTLEGKAKTGIGKVADDYYAEHKEKIVVTSGTRSAQSQAQAMYDKLKAGGSLSIYKNKKAADEVQKAYDDAVAAEKKQAETVKAMAKVIEGQVAKKVYLSKHLIKGAVDVRSKDMSADEKKTFKAAAEKHAKSVLLEKSPPHWHLQF